MMISRLLATALNHCLGHTQIVAHLVGAMCLGWAKA